MYSKQEAGKLRQEFWTSLGKYMQPVPNHAYETINWVNYRTGKKEVRIKTSSENRITNVMLETDPAFYPQLLAHKAFWPEADTWTWTSSGEFTGLIKTLEGPTIMNRSNWPEIISFLKKNLIELDEFWGQIKDFL